jgi:hypothetical protein
MNWSPKLWQKGWNRFLIIAALLTQLPLICLAANRAETSGSIFSATGLITVTNSYGKYQAAFVVNVSGARWSIQSSFVGETNRTLIAASEGDGIVRSLDTDQSQNPTFGIIESNNVPTDVGGLVPFVYTFFCAADLLGAQQEGYLTPVYDGNAGVLLNPKLRRLARWDWWEPGVKVLRRLTYYRRQSSNGGSEPVEDAEFRILSVTNLAGQLIPTSGEYVRYGVNSKKPDEGGWFIVTSATDIASTSFCPEPSGRRKIAIVDRRLYVKERSNSVMCYVSQEWPSLEKAQELELMKHAGTSPSPVARTVPLILLTISLLLPLWIALASRRRKAPNE